ncbi:hypothetical protein ACMT1E_04265 [Sphingomonas flavalba]|uniref:hypothetical protein n=1 Tax=Sphingomonas flavalba TaxID=2559804 RepID=UPI0039E05E83
MTWLIRLALSAGVPERLARPVVIAALVALAIVGLGVAKCRYDAALIARHDAEASTKALTRDAAAKEQAAIERRADDAAVAARTKGLQDAIDAAPDGAPGPATVALGCERLRRQGAAPADLPSACRP